MRARHSSRTAGSRTQQVVHCAAATVFCVGLAGLCLAPVPANAATALRYPEWVRLPLSMTASELIVTDLDGDGINDLLTNASGAAGFVRRDSGWVSIGNAGDNVSGPVGIQASLLGITTMVYSNTSVSSGGHPIMGRANFDATHLVDFNRVEWTFTQSNAAAGDVPGQFDVEPNTVFDLLVPVSGTPGRLYRCSALATASAIPVSLPANPKAAVVSHGPDDFVAVACAGSGPGSASLAVIPHAPGSTTWGTPALVPIPDGPARIARAQLGVARGSLIVLCPGANSVSVLSNSGTGPATIRTDYPASATRTGMQNMAVGDLNGDGWDDLVVSYASSGVVGVPGGFGVRFCNGSGGFGPETFYATGVAPRGLAITDWNRDGIPDVLVTHFSTDGVRACLGTGTGAFADLLGAVGQGVSGPFARCMVVGDVNGDGADDVTLGLQSTTSLGVALSTGPAGLGAPSFDDVGDVVIGIASGPAGAGGAQAFAVTRAGSVPAIVTGWPAIAVTPLDLDSETDPGPVDLADVNADGFLDIVSIGASTLNPTGAGHLTTRLSFGDGTFAPFMNTDTPDPPVRIVVMPFDGDVYPDVVILSGGSQSRSVFHGNGDGTFALSSTQPLGFHAPDLMFAFDSPPSFGSGFHLGHTFALARMRGPVAPADLLVLDADQPRVHLYAGNGAGGFAAQGTLDVGSSPTAIATGDVDGDSHSDIVTVNQNGNNPDIPPTLTVWFGDGTGLYYRRTDYLLDVPGVVDMQVGDVSGTLRPEIVLYRWPAAVVPQIPGSRPFAPARTLAAANPGVTVIRSFEFGTGLVSVGGHPRTPPSGLTLSVTPNPTHSRVALHFGLPADASVSVEILDVSGRHVRTIRPGVLGAGEHTLDWDGRGESGAMARAGVLFVKLTSGRGQEVRRLVWVP